jgi:Zn-dependent peptidase ImmA (M78 family)
MLASVGVKLICVPSLTSVSMNAATRWINDVPIIQLSSEVCKSNILAFTIFHEIGHIVLHGKKEIFLEESTSIELNKEKELEADNFAKKFVTRPRSK